MVYQNEIPNLQELIKDGIGGKILEQKVENLLPPGENYGSIVYKVDFKVKKEDKEEEYHAVAKCTPPNEITQHLFMTQTTFKSEIAWYTTIVPTLNQFRRDKGVENEIDFVQKFYGARISLDPKSEMVDLDGTILTQNLKYLGYYNEDRLIGFNESTALAILRDLATFHAVPLAIKIQNPELFNKNIKPYLTEYQDLSDDEVEPFNKELFIVFDKIPECQPIRERIKQVVEAAKPFGPRPVREPWATIIHMDFWTNNIMVTKGENPKTMFLDLANIAFGTPVADLLFFLLTSVKLDVVREKFDDFVKYYYEEFVKNLKELNVSTEDYSFKGLVKEMEAEAKIGEFAHALIINRIILGERGKVHFNSPDGSDKKEEKENFVPNETQIEKFRWIVLEAVKRNWI